MSCPFGRLAPSHQISLSVVFLEVKVFDIFEIYNSIAQAFCGEHEKITPTPNLIALSQVRFFPQNDAWLCIVSWPLPKKMGPI